MGQEQEPQTVDQLETELEQIQKDLNATLPQADSVEEKVAIYKTIIEKYQALQSQPDTSAKDRERIEKGIKYFQRRIEILEQFQLERRESIENPENRNLEITWIDDKGDVYLSNFIIRHPALADQFAAEIKAISESKPNSREAIQKTIELYTKLIKALQQAIDRHLYLTKRIDWTKKRQQTDSEKYKAWCEERKGLGSYKSLKKFRTKFAVQREGQKTAAQAFERFADERAKIEEKILTSIESGETVINEKVPYVIFVNKSDHEQYIVVFKYDKEKRKLRLKTFNLVSTGSPTRWDDNHTTISQTYYISHIFTPKMKGFETDYGSQYIDEDREPYKVFEMSYPDETGELKSFQYFMHLTPEENRLGTRQSHGCLRIPRVFNSDVNDIYLQAFMAEAGNNPEGWERYIKSFQSLDEQQLFKTGLRIPIMVADFMEDQFTELAREIANADLDNMDIPTKIEYLQDLHDRYLAIAAEADSEIGKLGTSKHHILSRRYFEQHKQKALTQARRLKRNIEYQKSLLKKEDFRKNLLSLKAETQSIDDPEVRSMLSDNIHKYLTDSWSSYQIEWCITMTRLAIKTYHDGSKMISNIGDPKTREALQKKFAGFVHKRLNNTVYKKMEEVKKNAEEWIETNFRFIKYYVIFANWVIQNQEQFPELSKEKEKIDKKMDLSHSIAFSRQLTTELREIMKI